ncbi:MAG: hypothetical protein NTX45_14265 [Proteobacteria bacterium]|nr:hypothetical protein [Pseudomonadota bacterium]
MQWIPILVDDDVSTNLLPPELSKIQFVDYRQQDRKATFRLAKSIAIVPPTPDLPDPLPCPPEVPISYLGGLTALVETASLLDYGYPLKAGHDQGLPVRPELVEG